MIIYRPAHTIATTKEAIARVQRVLDSIQGDELNSKTHAQNVKAEYANFSLFVRAALEFGMLLQVQKRGHGTNISIFYKTKIPCEIVEIKRKNPPRKKKQGDGSVLKPMFNHAIAKPETTTRRFEKSRLDIMGKLEDIGAYNVEYKMQRLSELRHG